MASRDRLFKSEWVRHSYQVHHGDNLIIFSIDLKETTSRFPFSLTCVSLSPDSSLGKGLPVQCSVCWPFNSSSGHHEGVHSHPGVGSVVRDSSRAVPE